MKKLLCLSIALIFLLASCSKNSSKSDSLNGDSAEIVAENDSNSIPMVVYATLTELKEIKTAFDSMLPDEFTEYMKSEKNEQYMSGMRDYESAKVLLDELAETTVPLLDGNSENFAEIAFYWETNTVYQVVMFDENKRVSVVIDTVESTQPKELELGDDVEFVSIKPVENNFYTANLYETKNADYLFFSDINIDDTYIVLRAMDIQTMEDFETCFARLEFVKIGDLLSEPPTKTTQTESITQITQVLEESTIVSEEKTETSTVISEETETTEQSEKIEQTDVII